MIILFDFKKVVCELEASQRKNLSERQKMEIDEQEVAVTEVASDMKLQAHPMNGILGRC